MSDKPVSTRRLNFARKVCNQNYMELMKVSTSYAEYGKQPNLKRIAKLEMKAERSLCTYANLLAPNVDATDEQEMRKVMQQAMIDCGLL